MFSVFFGEKMIFDENSKRLAKFEIASFDKGWREFRPLDIQFDKCPPQMSVDQCFCRSGAPSGGALQKEVLKGGFEK
jgi:hypothetical protein